MTTQEENELICEKLLGWELLTREPDGQANWMAPVETWRKGGAPTFLTGHDMLTLLELFAALPTDERPRVGQRMDGYWFCAARTFGSNRYETAPAAVRAAALALINGNKNG